MLWNFKKNSLLWLQSNTVMIKRSLDIKDAGHNYNNTLRTYSLNSAGLPLSRICINPDDKAIYISTPNNEYVKYVISDDKSDGIELSRVEMTAEAKQKLTNREPRETIKEADSPMTLSLSLFAKIIRRRASS